MIAADKRLRVFSITAARPYGRQATSYEACLVGGGARMTLVGPTKYRGLRRTFDEPTLAGSVVAYLEGQFGIDAGCEDLVVVNVATRRILRRVPQIDCSVDACFVHCEVVTDLVVDPRGSTAWIVRRGTDRSQKTLVVCSAPLTGVVTMLDEGPGIGATSLTLSSGALSWWHGGVQHTTALRP